MSVLRLKEILREKGLTGKELAEMVNVTEASISNLVKGDSIPRKDLLLSIAAALDIDVRELFVSTKQEESTPIYIKENGGYNEIGTINFEKFHIALNKGLE